MIDWYVSQDLPKQNQIRQKNTMARVNQERKTCLFTFTIFSPRARTVKMAQGCIHVGTISQTVILKRTVLVLIKIEKKCGCVAVPVN